MAALATKASRPGRRTTWGAGGVIGGRSVVVVSGFTLNLCLRTTASNLPIGSKGPQPDRDQQRGRTLFYRSADATQRECGTAVKKGGGEPQ